MPKFIDRQDELATLENEYRRQEAAFVVIYGRRRVGKTALIEHFCQNKRCLYFLATEENEQENRTMLRKQVAEALGNELLAVADLDRWEPVFQAVAAAAQGKERLILVLDEFQYLGKANAAFPSILMKIWDQILKKTNIMLILCGSLINMMNSQVLRYDSPLYGRRTAQIRLQQIPFRYYGDFVPGADYHRQIMQYAVTGGVPRYIELFAGTADIFTAIRRLVLSRNAFLYAEPEFLLQKEVTGVGTYFSILKTIAAGNHKLGKIATVLEIPQAGLTRYLAVLEDLDIIERQVPITEENPAKSKKGLYFLKDNFLEFWFKFVYPHKGMLEYGQTDFVLAKLKNNFIDNHVSFVYEDICRQKVWELLGNGLQFDRAGRWWGSNDVEIDIVAYDSTGTDILFGECKYAAKPKGMQVLEQLKAKAACVNWQQKQRKEFFALYSVAGFTGELVAYAQAHENILLLR